MVGGVEADAAGQESPDAEGAGGEGGHFGGWGGGVEGAGVGEWGAEAGDCVEEGGYPDLCRGVRRTVSWGLGRSR